MKGLPSLEEGFEKAIDGAAGDASLTGTLRLSVHPTKDQFFTASSINQICCWSTEQLLWRIQLVKRVDAVAIHPKGELMAIGLESGDIIVATTADGIQLTSIPISGSHINCLKYSTNGM